MDKHPKMCQKGICAVNIYNYQGKALFSESTMSTNTNKMLSHHIRKQSIFKGLLIEVLNKGMCQECVHTTINAVNTKSIRVFILLWI